MVAPSAASAAKFLSAPPAAVRGFLFYGPDAVQIAARAEALVRLLSSKAGSDAQIIRLHDSDLAADPGRIAVELGTGSLFGGTKIVWLTSCPAKAQAPLAEIIARPLEGSYLAVQAPDLKKSHKLVQAFEASPYLAAIASYGEDRESLSAAIRRHISSAGFEIGEDAAALVALRCDYSALLARSEAEKLMTFAGPSRRIGVEDVEACLIDQQTAGLSEIADHALNGEGKSALLAFERFMAAEQNVTPVLVVLSSALLRLHSLRIAVDAGTPVMQAIKELRPPVFFKQQDTLAAQVRRWPAQALSAQIARLNGAVKETRLRPALAGDIAADLMLQIAKGAR
ncbi:MAG: DNA polymerase III subunit delta [Rhodomicrobium sp.]|nr:DNA polymerase III subunit delta [Rhodomicrobium sp.]